MTTNKQAELIQDIQNITVIDAPCGAGKTQFAIQYMNDASPLEKFIFVTPFLSEVTRIKESVTNRAFVDPNVFSKTTKLEDLKKLLASGRDIVTTHALFAKSDEEVIDLLNEGGYQLILDEVFDVVEGVEIKRADIKRLITSRDIEIDETTKRVTWTGDEQDMSRYRDIREYAQAGNLYIFRDSFMVWAYPPSVFKTFSKVVILTYLFECQMQKYYFELYGFDYEKKAVEKVGDRYELCTYDARREKREDLRALITVCDNKKLNAIGDAKTALSQTKLKNYDVDILKQIRDNTSNFFRRYADNAKKDDVYISTLKQVEKELTPKGFKKRMIPHNARATNDYASCRAVAYLLNRYMNKHKASFFQDNGIKVNEDLYAVSELIQWLFRSRIRNGEPIHAYIPSSRMRRLLDQWANYEI